MLIKTTTVQATTRKLKAKWSAEMASDLKSLYNNESNMFQWNADNYKELHSCDAEYWHAYMNEPSYPSDILVQAKNRTLSRMLEPGTLCYLIMAPDQAMHIKKQAGSMVTVIRRDESHRVIGHDDLNFCFYVLGPEGEILVHVLDLMKIQIDQTKPRVSHWDIYKGIMF